MSYAKYVDGVNIEAWTHVWIKRYADYVPGYMLAHFGVGKENAVLISCNDDDFGENLLYRSRGEFQMPLGSTSLMWKMARFSHARLLPEAVNGFGPKPPSDTFHLSSLLQAAFPKDVRTGMFKGNMAGINALEEEYDDEEAAEHAAFAGLGVMLMGECRAILDPLATDRQVVAATDEMWIGLWGEGNAKGQEQA
jgi:hypothetical protein